MLNNIKVNFLMCRFDREMSKQSANLVGCLTRPYVTDSKDKIPLVNFGINLSPSQRQLRSEYDYGGTRCLVLDYDAKHSPLTYEQFAKQYPDLWSCQHIAYATASNTPETPKWRAIFPLATPISDSDLKLLIPRLKRLFPESDATAWQSSRYHNIPASVGQDYWHYNQATDTLLDLPKLVGVDDVLMAALRDYARERESRWKEEYERTPKITKNVKKMQLRDLGLTVEEWLATNWSTTNSNGGRRVKGSYYALSAAIKYNDWQTVAEIKRHSERCGLKGLDKTIATLTKKYC